MLLWSGAEKWESKWWGLWGQKKFFENKRNYSKNYMLIRMTYRPFDAEGERRELLEVMALRTWEWKSYILQVERQSIFSKGRQCILSRYVGGWIDVGMIFYWSSFDFWWNRKEGHQLRVKMGEEVLRVLSKGDKIWNSWLGEAKGEWTMGMQGLGLASRTHFRLVTMIT